jgi:GntR family transcriptional regulator
MSTVVLKLIGGADRMKVPNGDPHVPIPTTGYREVASDLQARIDSGEYPPGTQIPSYNQLAQLYSVSVTTIQRAILVLQAKGAVVGVQGRGVYVAEAPRQP